MCSINGCVVFDRFMPRGVKQLKEIDRKMKDIIVKGEMRGRDSFGVMSIDTQGRVEKEIKKIGKPSDYFTIGTESLIGNSTLLVMNNNRAEPTTEYVSKKSTSDVQPFSNGEIIVAHNGTIANDLDLEKKYVLVRETKIDTAILPPFLSKVWDGTTQHLASLFKVDIVGSYAIAIYRKGSDKFYLLTNYKPLFVEYNKDLDVLFYSSMESYMTGDGVNEVYNSNEKVIRVKPYTLLEIDVKTKKIVEVSLRGEKEKKKALIIASSGLDSTVSASWAIKQGYDIELLHFSYGARAEGKEVKQIKKIADFMKVPLTIIPMDIFSKVIKHSRLTNPDEEGELMKDREGEASAELAWEWVPARNLIFMSIASGYAEANKFDYIILGGNLEESGAYPDNELIFQMKFNEILPHALNLNNQVEVLMPVANLMKHEIIKLGLDVGAPLHLTWSCYEDRDEPCQKCGPDYMRRVGFKMNGIIDMQANDQKSKFWEGCNKVKFEKGGWTKEDDKVKRKS